MLSIETTWWRITLTRGRYKGARPRVCRPFRRPNLDGARWWWWFATKQLLFIFTMKDDRRLVGGQG